MTGKPEDLQPLVVDDANELEANDWLLTHDFHLREDFRAQVNLPHDLTREEPIVLQFSSRHFHLKPTKHKN